MLLCSLLAVFSNGGPCLQEQLVCVRGPALPFSPPCDQALATSPDLALACPSVCLLELFLLQIFPDPNPASTFEERSLEPRYLTREACAVSLR